jgi:hypothetical protein
MRSALGLCLFGLLAIACGEGKGPTAPEGPQSGGPPIMLGEVDANSPDEDSGAKPVGGRDAGSDAGSSPAYSCERVEALRSSGEDTPNLTSTDLPDDFVVTRQAVRWSTDCATAVLSIELSDGTCPRGNGHELDIDLSVAALQEGQIRLGNNEVSADSTNIVARYTRPTRLKPHGMWGSCGAASGQVVFLEAPGGLSKGQILQARYQLLLAACDGSTNAPIEVDGAFKLELRYDFASLCPGVAP